MKKELGIYIHIPFCKQKCYYCDFISYTNKNDLIKKYIEAVGQECENYNLDKYIVTSIYIGGGTPSFIDSECIQYVLKKVNNQFNIEKDCEITIEVNPGTVTKEKLETYKKCGINRLSIGLQSINNKLLKQIGRIHDYEEFLETYNMAKRIGFQNINIDLILGLPNQTIKDIKQEMEEVLKLNPKHISTYSLIVEEGTKLEKMIEEGRYQLLPEKLERQMYWYVKNMLQRNGYKHYEISNFSRKGNESKHNLNCWDQKEYIGLGIAAHSYLNKIRYSNLENIDEYIKNIQEGKYQVNRIIHENQSIEDEKKEFMLLGLRKIDGVSVKKYKNKFGENPIYIYKDKLKKLKDKNLIEISENRIKLTNKGIDLANIVWEEFV